MPGTRGFSATGHFSKLKVWERAHGLALGIYRETARFPARERYGLSSQLRRAAVSVASNIAESTGRHEGRDQIRLLRIARSSLRETQCQLLLARDLEFLQPPAYGELERQADETGRMLAGLITHLQNHRAQKR